MLAVLHLAQRHGPRHGCADRNEVEPGLEEPDKLRRPPVLNVPRRVAPLAPVGAASQIQDAPQRLARHAGEQVRTRDPGQDIERRLGLLQVLQHFAAHHEVGLCIGCAQFVDVRAIESRIEPFGCRLPVCLFRQTPRNIACTYLQAAPRQPETEMSFAAAGLVDRLGLRKSAEVVEGPQKAVHHSPRHRVAGLVFVVKVALGLPNHRHPPCEATFRVSRARSSSLRRRS